MSLAWDSFFDDTRGVVAVVAAGSIVVMGAVGALVIDGSRLYMTKNQLQTMADEAALMAAYHAAQGEDEAIAQARRIAKSNNGKKKDAEEIVAVGDEVEIEEPDVVFGRWEPATRAFTPDATPHDAVAVSVRRDQTTFLAPLLGVKSMALEATAVARLPSGAICLLALDPSANQAISLDSNARIVATDCSVQANSAAGQAINVRSNSTVTAEEILITGGFGGSSSRFTPFPETGVAPAGDPLAHITAPDVGGCTYTNRRYKNTDVTISPGVYCGGLDIDGNVKITLEPGVYIMKDGPLRLDSNSELAGDGVGFYLTGDDAVLDFNSNVKIDLKAPRSGPLAGLVFFEDRNAPLLRTHRLDSNNATRLEGTIYLSRGLLSMASNTSIAANSAFTSIIVQRVELNSNSRLVLNAAYDTTDVPRTIPPGHAKLVN